MVRRAFSRQLQLRRDPFWQEEIPERCSPVVWFGDRRARRTHRLVTLAANPSRREFLAADHTTCLEGAEARLHLCAIEAEMESATGRGPEELVPVVGGYDLYFECNPYTQWFGRKKDPYKVECALRGLGASYYLEPREADDSLFAADTSACHIDLVPFVTRRDFRDLEEKAPQRIREFLTADGWAAEFLVDLVGLLRPEAILAFGPTNVALLHTHLGRILTPVDRPESREYRGCAVRKQVAIVSVPVLESDLYLANPVGRSHKGWPKTELRAFGRLCRDLLGW